MEKVPISKFKAKYRAILKRLRKLNQPMCLTRFGQPVAEIRAVPKPRTGVRRLGTLRDSLIIHGGIDAPISSEDDWDAARGVWEPELRNKKKGP